MAQLVKRRVANPAPSVLALVNKTRRRNMATQKRKKSSTRRRTSTRRAANSVNSTRRRQSKSTRRRSTVKPVFARRRRSPRRHNPTAGLAGKAFTLAGAGALIGITQPFVRNFVGPYVGAGPLVAAGVTFGTAWGLSLVAGMIPFTRRWKDDILLAGGTIAAAQLISTYVLPALRIGGGGGSNGMGRYGNRYGIRGIAAVHGVPPHILPPPPPQANGMKGIAAGATGWR